MEPLAALASAHGAEPPLDLALAWIAADEAGLGEPEVAAMLRGLDALGARLHLPERASTVERVARLNHLLFVELGFAGDDATYDAPENSCLDQVLARRRGLPILLSALAMEVGRRAGLTLDGVAFPAHFLVAPRGAEPRFWLDPFHQGRVLREPELRASLARMGGGATLPEAEVQRLLGRCTHRALLLRVNHNLKRTHLARGHVERALRACERALALDPDAALDRRDQGLLLARLGRVEAAREALGRYMREHPDAPDARAVRDILYRLG